jgi:hypothetical protein
MKLIFSIILSFSISFSFAQWDQIAQTVYGDQEFSFFGQEVSVSDDGSTVAVSATIYSSNGLVNNGIVRIYRLINNQWTQIGQDLAGIADSEEMGNSLSLNEDGNIIAIGVDQANVAQGKVLVYAYSNNNWSLMGSPLNGNQQYGRFGTCVSISNSGETLAVARQGFNGIYGAHIFEYNGSNWIEAAVGGSQADVRSISIDAAGEHVIYGGSSYIHFFDKVDNVWTGGSSPYSTTPSGVGGDNGFLAMSGDGNVYAIGAELNDDFANNAGLVKIFNRTDPNALEVFNVYGISLFTSLGKSVSLNHDGTKFMSLGNISWIYERSGSVYNNIASVTGATFSACMNSEGDVLVTGYRDYENVNNGEYGWLKVFGDLPNSAPVLDCPANIEVAASVDLCGAMVELPEILATDLEDGSIVAIQTDGIPSGEFFAIGSHTVTFTATDSDGLSVSCSIEVIVTDEDAPQAICASPTIFLDETGFAALTEMDVDGGSTDNCGIVTVTFDQTPFNCDQLGTQTVEVSFADQQGNTSTCITSVTVADLILPEITCTDLTLELNADGMASVQSSMLVADFSDNCAASFSTEEYVFGCSDIGSQNIISTVTDNSGNVASCTSVVTVVDVIAPVIMCPSNQMEEIESGTFALPDYTINSKTSANDNCSSSELDWTQTPAAGMELGVGIHNIMLTASDASGNETSCSFQLEISLVNSVGNMELETISIYPNPASNVVRIQTTFSASFQLTVMNAFGQVVMNDWMTNGSALDISEIAAGHYILKIEQGSSVDFVRLIVIK